MQKDYEQFKKLKLMELQAIEKEKEYLEAKKLSKRSASKKSDKSIEMMSRGMKASQNRDLDLNSPDLKGNVLHL